MSKKVHRYLLRLALFALCMLTATMTSVVPASSRSVAPQQATVFLSAPYYGSTWVSSIFDHDVNNRYILALSGVIADRDSCPCIAPQPCRHPTFPSAYYSCTINDYLYYNNHNGVDYVLRYDYVRAAAAGQVGQAGWQFPGNHGGVGSGLGLYVRVDHSNGYQTFYGHMSVLRVRQNDVIPANADEFERILGISGDTGESSGPHLHFEVRDANGTPVDPYGPNRNPNDKLWIERPSIDPHIIYTSGDRPFAFPPIVENESGYFTIDDGSTNFVENPAGCWTVDNTDGWAGDYRHRTVPGGNCTARWSFPQNRAADWYHVFVYVPNFWDPAWPDWQAIPANRNATVDAAQYTIRHTESPSRPWSKQTNRSVVNQWAYPNGYHRSPWVYAGTYYFDSNQYGTDYVQLESQAMDPVGQMRMTADAVRFSPVVYRTYLPLVMKRWPPIPDTPVLNSIYNPNGSSSYTVRWNSAQLADTYVLEEATNPSFGGAVTRYYGSGTSWTATEKAPGTYYYRVKARNSWGDSGWSNTQQTTVWPTATTFDSVADAMVRSGYPTSNYGSYTYMRAGYAGSAQVMRSLVRFDLSGIPSGTPVGQAKLWLYMHYSYDPPGSPRTIATYRVTSSWTEGGVTWNTQPGGSGLYGFTSIPYAAYGWYSFDVTDLVRGWVNGSYTNYGVWILGNESPSDPNYRSFRTRDSSTGLKPYLEITYGESMGASSSRTGEEILPVSPLAIPEAPAVLEMPRSPLPVPEP